LGGIQDANDISIVSVGESAVGGIMFDDKTVIEMVSDLITDNAEDKEWSSGEQSGSHDKRIEENEPGVEPQGHAKPAQCPIGTTFVYKPIWDVRRKVLSTYHCVPKWTDSSETPVFGYDIISGINPEEAYPDLDLLTLEAVRQALNDLHGRERRVLMVSPVHYRTLVRNDSFEKFRIYCQSMTESLTRDLIFELVGVPDVISDRRVIELVSALKGIGRSVVVPASLNRTRFEELSIRGFDTVSTDIGEFAGNESEAMQVMDAFLTGSSQAGMRTVAHGLETLTLATYAVAAGFDFVEGRAVHDIVENPEHVFRFQTQDLFAKIMGAAG